MGGTPVSSDLPMGETQSRGPSPNDDGASGFGSRFGQSGAMLVEVMLAVSLSALLLGGFLGWALLSITHQQSVRTTNDETFGLGLASV